MEKNWFYTSFQHSIVNAGQVGSALHSQSAMQYSKLRVMCQCIQGRMGSKAVKVPKV